MGAAVKALPHFIRGIGPLSSQGGLDVKKLMVVSLVVLALVVVPSVAAQEVEPGGEAPDVEEGEELEESEGIDLGELTSDLGKLAVVGLVGWIVVITNEVAFERLVSLPFVEKHAKWLKPYQPYLVVLSAVVLVFVAKIDAYAGLAEITNMLNSLPGDGNFIATGVIAGLLSMAYHEKKGNGSVIGSAH
jgi:hypothetical protein